MQLKATAAISRRLLGAGAPLFAACAVAGLGACGAIFGTSVEGRMLHTPETFSGTSTASIGGTGKLLVVSDKGVKCFGRYQQVPDENVALAGTSLAGFKENSSSVVKLKCDDGRRGSVLFLVGQDQAVGTGMLGEDIVTLTIE